MRLRTLTEAECYARCYGARDERVSLVVKDDRAPEPATSHLRRLVERRLAEQGPTREAEAA